jgi:hypothetical protein
LPCSCEVLASEANLKIAERGEDKADARQGARLKAARHFPHIHKHCTPKHIDSTCSNFQNRHLYQDTTLVGASVPARPRSREDA